MTKKPLKLFGGFGIELEYMLVDAATLDVKPCADALLQAEHGSVDDVERGPIAWSNELVNHVIELKTNGPAADLTALPGAFAHDVTHINGLLAEQGARLMPTGMHPWMDPQRETVLWPHEHSTVYETFDAIFDCRGHGWSNLQSSHLNLPFCGDVEFGQLHAAIRLLLPILPALAASSPFCGGRLGQALDERLRYYRDNARRVPSVSGHVIPEQAYTRKDYELSILARIYRDMADFDPAGVLQHEWVNARGAIARFERDAIEIRLLDVQECPAADVAIAAASTAVLQALVAQRLSGLAEQQAFKVAPLATLFRACMTYGGAAIIDDASYLRALGLPKVAKLSVAELWQHLLGSVWSSDQAAPFATALQPIVAQGPLSQRIVQACGKTPSRTRLKEVYGELCACLHHNRSFLP